MHVEAGIQSKFYQYDHKECLECQCLLTYHSRVSIYRFYSQYMVYYTVTYYYSIQEIQLCNMISFLQEYHETIMNFLMN